MATKTTSRMTTTVVGTIIMIRVSCFSERGGDGGSVAEFPGSWVESVDSGSEFGESGDSVGTEGVVDTEGAVVGSLAVEGGGGGGGE